MSYDATTVKATIEKAFVNLLKELKDNYDIDITLEQLSRISIQPLASINLDDIESKQDLKRRTLSDLKDICKSFKLRYSGKKDELIDRIWGVKCPDDAPLDSKPKKRGRKSKHFVKSPDNSPNNSPDNSPDNSPKSQSEFDNDSGVESGNSSTNSSPLNSP